MNDFHIRSVRGTLTETTHRVSAVVVDRNGKDRASIGSADLVVPMRSAAKPFQAFPLVSDGVIDAFNVSSRELALACASHNSEVHQVEIVQGWLDRIGVREDQLVCGPHGSLVRELGFPRSDGSWEEVTLASPSRVASNCSGKHTGMLALATHHGWNTSDYDVLEHPVQQRIRTEVAEWCDVPAPDIGTCVDGCGVVSWAVPLRAMARAYARLTTEGPWAPIVRAMTSHPELVAGARRSCTALMAEYPGKVLAKMGADGVYGAALLDQGLGVAIKVHDGNSRATAVALIAVLDRLGLDPCASDRLSRFAKPVLLNTNREVVGHYEAVGDPF